MSDKPRARVSKVTSIVDSRRKETDDTPYADPEACLDAVNNPPETTSADELKIFTQRIGQIDELKQWGTELYQTVEDRNRQIETLQAQLNVSMQSDAARASQIAELEAQIAQLHEEAGIHQSNMENMGNQISGLMAQLEEKDANLREAYQKLVKLAKINSESLKVFGLEIEPEEIIEALERSDD